MRTLFPYTTLFRSPVHHLPDHRGCPVRRRNKVPPPRTRHSDPAVELQLQQIHGLLARVDQKTGMIDDYREEIRKLHHQIRMLTSYGGYAKDTARHDDRISRLQQAIRDIDGEIDAASKQIAGLQEGMSPMDLAYLW
jgi:hypothetical protein